MIPAILSCVYVIYLYKTLNEPSSSSVADSSDVSSTLDDRLKSLSDRIAALSKL